MGHPAAAVIPAILASGTCCAASNCGVTKKYNAYVQAQSGVREPHQPDRRGLAAMSPWPPKALILEWMTDSVNEDELCHSERRHGAVRIVVASDFPAPFQLFVYEQ